MAIFPIYTKLFEDDGKEATAEFLEVLLKYYACLVILILCFAVVLSEEVIVLLASGKFAESARIVPVVLSSIVINGTYHMTGAGFFLYARTKQIGVYVAACAVGNVMLNALLIPRYGILGAAWSTLVSYLVLTILITVKSRKSLMIWSMVTSFSD